MARRGFVEIGALTRSSDGTGIVLRCKMTVIRDGVTSPTNPIADIDEFNYEVAVTASDSAQQLKKKVIDDGVTAATSTGLTAAEVLTMDPSSQLILTGTGDAPSATGLPNGTLYIKYTP